MKITRLNLISFGKFKNKIIDMTGKTVIYGANEAGKSTAAEFIRIMLLGAKARSGDRKRFTPWDGDVIEGELTLEIRDSEYIIHRIIGASSRSDRLSVLCTSTGEVSSTLPFAAEEAVLERTAFMAQQSAVFDKGADLGASLRETVFGGYGGEVDAALKVLAERRRLITNPRGKYKGELDLARERLDSLLSRQSAAENEKNRLPELEARLREAEREYAAAKNELSGASGNDHFNSLSEKAKDLLRRVGEAEEAVASLRAKADNMERETEVRRGPLAFKRLMLPAAALLAVLGLVLGVWLSPLAAVVPVIAAAAFAAAMIFTVRRDTELTAALTAARKESDRAEEELNGLRREYRAAVDAAETAKREAAAALRRAESRLDAGSKTLYSLKAEIEKAAALRPEAYDGDISAAREDVASFSRKLDDINAAEEGIKSSLRRIGESWLPMVSEAVSRRASKILGRNIQVYADEALNLSIRENGVHPADSLSGGTRDQLYLALRLAAAEIIFSDDLPPLVLDDPFVQYDRERQENAIDILLKYANENQIIIFTCKNPAVFSDKGFNILTI